jgi:putative addiction module component (TIGR02574 family)
MSTNALKFCVEALSLPRKTRAEIAERLLASLEEEETPGSAEKAWKAEIRRRRREIREGKGRLRPADQVMRDALRVVA